MKESIKEKAQIDVVSQEKTIKNEYAYKKFLTKDGIVIFTICGIFQPEFKQVKIGLARLSESDYKNNRFCRRTGREISQNRAMKDPYKIIPNIHKMERNDWKNLIQTQCNSYPQMQAFFESKITAKLHSRMNAQIRQEQESIIAKIIKLRNKIDSKVLAKFEFDVLELLK